MSCVLPRSPLVYNTNQLGHEKDAMKCRALRNSLPLQYSRCINYLAVICRVLVSAEWNYAKLLALNITDRYQTNLYLHTWKNSAIL